MHPVQAFSEATGMHRVYSEDRALPALRERGFVLIERPTWTAEHGDLERWRLSGLVDLTRVDYSFYVPEVIRGLSDRYEEHEADRVVREFGRAVMQQLMGGSAIETLRAARTLDQPHLEA